MAEEAQYSSDGANNKRKYDDQAAPPSTRRPTGFSAPIAPPSPDSSAPPSYNNVAPPADEIQIAKQRAQEIAARLYNSASGLAAGASPLDAVKRPRVENGGYDSGDNKGFSSAPPDAKPLSSYSAPSAMPMSYGGFQGSSKKIDIPNNRVGVIIGKAGDTIKYLQVQSGAKIQVTRDADSDPNSTSRAVELTGNPDQIAKAESLIKEVLQEAEIGGSALVARRLTGQGGAEQFTMRVPNNKVGLVIGKGGETIKSMQAQSGARIQVIPLHLPPGDTSTERTVQIEGSSEQIELAKQLVAEVTSENRPRNSSMGGGYQQQGYQARPSYGNQMSQSGYGYGQPGAYPGQSGQYNMAQPTYGGYPPQQGSWDQSSQSAAQTGAGGGYDYYSQQAQQQQAPGGPGPAADNSGYDYSQAQAAGYGQQGQGYQQDGYGGYQAAQSGYGQQASYDQQGGYGSAPTYGNAANPTQEAGPTSYGAQAEAAQAPSAQSTQGYGTGQLTSPGAGSYPPQSAAAATQPGYGVPPASQAGYGAAGYGAPPQAQKAVANPQAYGQTQQSPTNPGAYGQPAGYGAQPPSSGYAAAPPQAGYGAQAYGGAPPAYGQAPGSYGAYGGGYSQAPPPAYSGDGKAAPAASQTAPPSGVAKVSPPS